MSSTALQTKRTARYVFSGILILAGFLIVTGIISLSPTEAWFPWILTLTGVLILSVPAESRTQAGVVTTALGVYLLLRHYDLISVPALGYLLGGFLLLVGVVNIVRNSKGGEVPLKKTFSKSTKED